MSEHDETPATWLAAGLAAQVQRWALATGAAPAAARAASAAAHALSLAVADGHVCLHLAELAAPAALADAAAPAGAGTALPATGDLPAWRTLLHASGVVGRAAEPRARPLVLDDDDRLYLHRYFDFERRLARRLLRCAAPAQASDPAGDARIATQLATLFAANAPARGEAADPPLDWQRLATALAWRNRLTVISGGPGTGKTTTVVNLLACLLQAQPEARIVLAAPTGKAAARLSEALRQRAGHLPEALRARLPAEAFTIHRLLAVRPPGGRVEADGGDGGFVHHAGHPLALDALVLDEASMIDLALATRLLEAVPDHARIILLGDKDQLAAVESGSVFAELSADPTLGEACIAHLAKLTGAPAARIRPAAPLAASPLRDIAVWFDRNYRFAADSGIGRLAADIVHGRSAAALAWLREGDDDSVHWLADSGAAPAAGTMARIAAGYAPYLDACAAATQAADPSAALPGLAEAFARFRVLCALREGARGVISINAAVSALARHRVGATGDRSPWYPGRPVMVLRNEPTLRLFNGDIGLTLPGADGQPMVHFPAADGGFRAVAPVRLPAHETAFAMTVHKSQGSEFDAVLLLLPAQRSRVLGRELLYTGVTRARRQVLLAAGAEVLAAAMQTAARRHSGLLARLREGLQG